MTTTLDKVKSLDALLVQLQDAFAKKRKVNVTLKPGHLMKDDGQYADRVVEAPLIKDKIKLSLYVYKIIANEVWLMKEEPKQSKLPLDVREYYRAIIPHSAIERVTYKNKQ